MLGSGYEVFMKFEPPALNVDQDEYMEKRVNFFEEHFSQYTDHNGVPAKPDVNGLRVTYIVDVATTNVPEMMRELEKKCPREQVEDWSCSQVREKHKIIDWQNAKSDEFFDENLKKSSKSTKFSWF